MRGYSWDSALACARHRYAQPQPIPWYHGAGHGWNTTCQAVMPGLSNQVAWCSLQCWIVRWGKQVPGNFRTTLSSISESWSYVASMTLSLDHVHEILHVIAHMLKLKPSHPKRDPNANHRDNGPVACPRAWPDLRRTLETENKQTNYCWRTQSWTQPKRKEPRKA